MKSQIVFSS